ncbi:MAG: response regulator [Chloroflexales bacterium]|nr:response regulator [Chloroflexales bacterium]
MTKKVLIVDDEPNIVTSLEFLMERNGYEFQIARNGDEALAWVRSFEPDLILLDVMMPQRSGFEVCQTIRENPAWNTMKIIMLTAKGRDIEVTKGLALGADSYVTKPFSTKELLAKVREMLGD